MKYRTLFLAALLALVFFQTDQTSVQARQSSGPRQYNVTLIPDYEGRLVQFHGSSELLSRTAPTVLAGLELDLDRNWWMNTSWKTIGTFVDSSIRPGRDAGQYVLTIGPITLEPLEELSLVLPFVIPMDSDIQRIQPPPDDGGANATPSHLRLVYSGGLEGKEDLVIEIPFIPVVREIDLVLTPLIGEMQVGRQEGLRLSGRVRFAFPSGFAQFATYCPYALGDVQDGAYRRDDLLYALDYPHFTSPDILHGAFQFKPTSLDLRSEFVSCQYDPENDLEQAEATFSGRVFASDGIDPSYPTELEGFDFQDSNNPSGPEGEAQGMGRYEIQLGEVRLGPGDILNITVPGTDIDLEGLFPPPAGLSLLPDEEILITYRGPATFHLVLPYVPRSELSYRQLPTLLRPRLEFLEDELEARFPIGESALTWIILLTGFFLVLVQRIMRRGQWLAALGWFGLMVGFYYGVRGSFGLLCLAAIFYILQLARSTRDVQMTKENIGRISRALASFVLIAAAVYLDREGTDKFEQLSTAELSPLTPLVLLILVSGMFLVLYGARKNADGFNAYDLPALALLLLVPSLYDVIDKSLLALALLFLGGVYILPRAAAENGFGQALQERMALVFGNGIVPLSLFILIVFAIVNDLDSTFAHQINVDLGPLPSSWVLPLLNLVSVFVTFTSVALLFVLVFPHLPFTAGYVKAVWFAVFLLFIFLLGLGTDDRLILSLPSILIGRALYYLSAPLLIGVYLDINNYMQNENTRRIAEGKKEKPLSFPDAARQYFGNLRRSIGGLATILSLVAPPAYNSLSSQPVVITYFSLLENLVGLGSR